MYILEKNFNSDDCQITETKLLIKRYGTIKVVKNVTQTRKISELMGISTEIYNIKWINTGYGD